MKKLYCWILLFLLVGRAFAVDPGAHEEKYVWNQTNQQNGAGFIYEIFLSSIETENISIVRMILRSEAGSESEAILGEERELRFILNDRSKYNLDFGSDVLELYTFPDEIFI